jgi:hypothetical protein
MEKNKFRAHTLAFLLMVFPAAGLFFAAEAGSGLWIGLLLSLVILGNLLALILK